MSSDIAIKVENISKCFQIYDRPRDRLKQFVLPRLQRVFCRSGGVYFREFWALKNISFEIKKGETVGIVGRNGSGKSTLLQLICGTLSPTSGNIQTNGRIAALLELGSGFNPEFSGRENVYLNGAVLGLCREEIDNRIDDIIAFAEIEQFIDQPVKTYSSGMMVRLAFAVAINVDPQILIVDEALSVGDELFQRKCFSRIEAIRAAGATILFVSHSGGTVLELCDRALLLDSGEYLTMGTPKKVIGSYQKLLYVPDDKRDVVRTEIRLKDADASTLRGKSADGVGSDLSFQLNEQDVLSESYDSSLKPVSTIFYESHGAFIEDAAIYTKNGDRVNNLMRGEVYIYRYYVRFNVAAFNIRFGMLVKTTNGVELGGATSTISNRDSIPAVVAGSVFLVEFKFLCCLNAGVYFLNSGVLGEVDGGETYLHRVVDVAMFRVISESESNGTGIVDFSCVPSVKLES